MDFCPMNAKIEMLQTGQNQNGGNLLGSPIKFYLIIFDIIWHRYKWLSVKNFQKMPFYAFFEGSCKITVSCTLRENDGVSTFWVCQAIEHQWLECLDQGAFTS
jgi:hypothetical protein